MSELVRGVDPLRRSINRQLYATESNGLSRRAARAHQFTGLCGGRSQALFRGIGLGEFADAAQLSMLRCCSTAATLPLRRSLPVIARAGATTLASRITASLCSQSILRVAHRNMASTATYERPPMLPPSLHDPTQALQLFPALLSLSEHAPPSYPFGRIALPAAGVFFASLLSYVSVNQSPLMAGHVLVMPRSNIARVKDLPEEQVADLWLVAQHVARVFEERFKAEAMTFGQQRGQHSRSCSARVAELDACFASSSLLKTRLVSQRTSVSLAHRQADEPSSLSLSLSPALCCVLCSLQRSKTERRQAKRFPACTFI